MISKKCLKDLEELDIKTRKNLKEFMRRANAGDSAGELIKYLAEVGFGMQDMVERLYKEI